MSPRGRAPSRRDAIHDQIACAFRAALWRVKEVHMVGGWVDLIVCSPRGVLHLVEIKSPGGTISDSQADLHRDWPVDVVRSVEDVARIVSRR